MRARGCRPVAEAKRGSAFRARMAERTHFAASSLGTASSVVASTKRSWSGAQDRGHRLCGQCVELATRQATALQARLRAIGGQRRHIARSRPRDAQHGVEAIRLRDPRIPTRLPRPIPRSFSAAASLLACARDLGVGLARRVAAEVPTHPVSDALLECRMREIPVHDAGGGPYAPMARNARKSARRP